MNDKHSDWTEHERRTLRELDAEVSPPADLEDRVVQALRARGHLAEPRPRWRWMMPVLRLAAAGAVLALVFWSGTWFERSRGGPETVPKAPSTAEAQDGHSLAQGTSRRSAPSPRTEPLVVRSSVDYLAFSDFSDFSEAGDRAGKYRSPAKDVTLSTD